MKTLRVISGVCALLTSVFAQQAQTIDQAKTLSPARAHGNFRSARPKSAHLPLGASIKFPSNADCINLFGTTCYTPQNIRDAYGVTSLLNAGFTGSGQTIVIIVSFGSPTIEEDLKKFDTAFGLPDPPSFRILAPLGTVPFDPNDTDHLIWASETSLDVEWAHAMAPGANIVLLTSPVDETQGVKGLPEFLQLEQYALKHHLGHIFSQSWGTAENTLFDTAGRKVLSDFEAFYEEAVDENITLLAAAGDTGTENVDVNGNPYPFPTVDFPASSPYVTAVGATTLNLDAKDQYLSETVWNNGGASGGGVSQFFPEPNYQHPLPMSVQKTLKGHRGIPDVAFNGDPNTPIWVYFGFFPNPQDNGFSPIGSGTSAGTVQWAGIVADVSQLTGRPLGFLNPNLYAMTGGREQSEFFHDITVGDNSFNGLPGYKATLGWDLASGWGTPNFSNGFWRLR